MSENEGTAVNPAFTEEWSVNFQDIDWPETVIGIYHHSPPQPTEEGKIKRMGILTSEGWLPPAPRTIVYPVSQVADSPNSIPATRERGVAKLTRTVINPVELREKVPNGTVVASDKVAPVIRRLSNLDVEFFIPDELTDGEKADLIVAGVEGAKSDCVEDSSKSVTADAIAGRLSEFYSVSTEVAEIAIARSDIDIS